jgi:hypothetical protein
MKIQLKNDIISEYPPRNFLFLCYVFFVILAFLEWTRWFGLKTQRYLGPKILTNLFELQLHRKLQLRLKLQRNSFVTITCT